MGEVYLAQHPRLPRRDALKLLARDVSADPSFRERLLREADLASTLWHPHVVGVHDRGEYQGQLWIAMDFVDGRADQYSLAATGYHLLTGTPLFPRSNPAVVISHHRNTAPPALADTRPELSALDPVLAAALAKNSDDRFPRCSDFARTLAEQTHSAGAPTPAASTTPAPVSRSAASTSEPPAAAMPKPAETQGRDSRRLPLVAAAADDTGGTPVRVDGEMIDRPRLELAHRILASAAVHQHY